MKKLFVGNIPHSTTEAELRTLFAAHGAVEQVSVVTDRDTGRSRGFAFVEMTNDDEAERAIAALNGKELNGRALNIASAQLRPGDRVDVRERSRKLLPIENAQQLLQGPLKHVRRAALAAALLPLASVAATPAAAQNTMCASSGGNVCGFVWNDTNANGPSGDMYTRRESPSACFNGCQIRADNSAPARSISSLSARLPAALRQQLGALVLCFVTVSFVLAQPCVR